jgi:hypothetical protein
MSLTAIYGLFDPRNPEVICYVGKGLAKRAAMHWSQFVRHSTACNKNLVRWFAVLRTDGAEPGWCFLEENVPLSMWEEREKFWIAYWRQKNPQLCNVTKGGNAWPPEAYNKGGRNVRRETQVRAGRIGGRATSETTDGRKSNGGRACPREAAVRGGRNGSREAKARGGRNCPREAAVRGGVKGIRALNAKYKGTLERKQWSVKGGRNGGPAGALTTNHYRHHLNRDRCNIVKCFFCFRAAMVCSCLANAPDPVGFITRFEGER